MAPPFSVWGGHGPMPPPPGSAAARHIKTDSITKYYKSQRGKSMLSSVVGSFVMVTILLLLNKENQMFSKLQTVNYTEQIKLIHMCYATKNLQIVF